MIRVLYWTQEDGVREESTVESLEPALGDGRTFVWLDLSGEPPGISDPILRNSFGFHPLAVDDALRESHIPKLDDWGEYLYLVLHALDLPDPQELEPHTLELDLFVGPRYLVTVHDRAIDAVDREWLRCQQVERHLRRAPAYLLYRIADELADDSMPVVERMDRILEQLEDEIFGQSSRQTLERIFELKRAVVDVRRILAPQREVLNKLARNPYTTLSTEDQMYFRDVYDHLVRLHDINDGVRDQATGALETYLSTVNNQMNEVMKTLTIISTTFMPISFLTGFFGMNFFQPTDPMTMWTRMPMFVLAVLIMLATPGGILLFARRRGWF